MLIPRQTQIYITIEIVFTPRLTQNYYIKTNNLFLDGGYFEEDSR